MTHILGGCTTNDGQMEGIKIDQRIAHPTPFLSQDPRFWCGSVQAFIPQYLLSADRSQQEVSTVPVVDIQWTLVPFEESGDNAV